MLVMCLGCVCRIVARHKSRLPFIASALKSYLLLWISDFTLIFWKTNRYVSDNNANNNNVNAKQAKIETMTKQLQSAFKMLHNNKKTDKNALMEALGEFESSTIAQLVNADLGEIDSAEASLTDEVKEKLREKAVEMYDAAIEKASVESDNDAALKKAILEFMADIVKSHNLGLGLRVRVDQMALKWL